MTTVYYYTPREAGLTEFPSGLMRLEGFEEVPPDKANVFVLPCILRAVPKENIYKLPYLKGNEARHIFWQCAEDVKLWYELPCLFVRCDATKEILQHDPNTIGWSWPCEDLYRPHEPFQYDVTFRGWESTPLSRTVVESCQKAGLNGNFLLNKFFYGYHYHDPEYQHYKESYRDALSKSRLSLVPRSIPEGVVRYRAYEAMSMGRVFVHFADGAVMPFSNHIQWDKCSITIPEKDAENCGEILKEWLSKHNDAEIQSMGSYGRACWERWLDSRKWNALFAQATEEHLDKMGMAVRP